MTLCRSLADIDAAAAADHDGPMDQATADLVAAIRATAQDPQAA